MFLILALMASSQGGRSERGQVHTTSGRGQAQMLAVDADHRCPDHTVPFILGRVGRFELLELTRTRGAHRLRANKSVEI